MNRTTLALAVTIPALCMGAVNAQTTNIPLPPALLACAEETDVLRRLACFDREVARLRDVPESVPEPAPEPTVAAPWTRANPEEETERRRAEAERKRLEDLERQRPETVHSRNLDRVPYFSTNLIVCLEIQRLLGLKSGNADNNKFPYPLK